MPMKTIDSPLFPEGTTVAGTQENSATQEIKHCWGWFSRVVYTGASLAGTIKPQASLDGNTWFDLPNSGETAHHTISASGGDNQWNITDAYYPFVRMQIDETSANTLTVTTDTGFFAKGV